LAEKIALSKDFSCVPLAMPSSDPPWSLDAWSIEKRLATLVQLWPFCSACLALLAWAAVFVRTTRRSRVAGVAKRALFFL
jgi:hypothetical protein